MPRKPSSKPGVYVETEYRTPLKQEIKERPDPPPSTNIQAVEAEQRYIYGATISKIVGRMREVATAIRKGSAVSMANGAQADPNSIHGSEYLLLYADAIQAAETALISDLSSLFRDMSSDIVGNPSGLKYLLEDLASAMEDLSINPANMISIKARDYLTIDEWLFTKSQFDYVKKEEFQRGFNIGFKSAFRNK
jgi:hypothetical protein